MARRVGPVAAAELDENVPYNRSLPVNHPGKFPIKCCAARAGENRPHQTGLPARLLAGSQRADPRRVAGRQRRPDYNAIVGVVGSSDGP